MKACWGSRDIAPLILDLGTIWRLVFSFTLRPLYPQGKIAWNSLDRRLGGPQSRSGCCGEDEDSQPLPGLEPPIIQPVSQSGLPLCCIPPSSPHSCHTPATLIVLYFSTLYGGECTLSVSCLCTFLHPAATSCFVG
jgi:hypothetical protein